MAERLYELAREYAGLTGSETVYDLYCGIGTIGLVLARDALTVWGVEISEESVACAIENAELNGIANAAFFAGERRPVARGAARPRGRPGRRRRRSAARGPGGEGAAPRRRARPRRARLRLVQPDDARRRREGAGRGLRLPARARAAGRHVPAHAARRDGGAPRRAAASRPLGRPRAAGARSRARAGRRSATRNPTDRSGSAGRPAMSNQSRQTATPA